MPRLLENGVGSSLVNFTRDTFIDAGGFTFPFRPTSETRSAFISLALSSAWNFLHGELLVKTGQALRKSFANEMIHTNNLR